MGKAIYAVLGDSRGHLSRALTVAGLLPRHQFLFLGSGRALEVRDHGYEAQELPLLGTYYKNNRVDLSRTLFEGLKLWFSKKSIMERVCHIIREYDPDLIITDYEYFTPLAAKKLGRPCHSLDNQHALTHCHYVAPPKSTLNRAMTTFSVSRFFSSASHYLVTAFFEATPKDPLTTEIFPPIIRPGLANFKTSLGDHALVYQTSPTFEKLFEKLKTIDEKFIIYGFGERAPQGGLIFKGNSDEGFLQDLATCKYCIVNGGHNVISEALFFNKPVFCFPIGNAYEQLVNANYLKLLNYGDYCYHRNPEAADLKGFAKRLENYREAISGAVFNGNDLIRSRLDQLIRNSPKK